MLRRSFSTASKSSPGVLVAKSGDFVLSPPNADGLFDFPIAKVGIDALKQFLPETSTAARLRNQAQYNYLQQRDLLLRDYKQRWLAMSSNGSMFLGNHEDVVRTVAHQQFVSEDEDYFIDCLGCEVLMEAVMDGDAGEEDEEEERSEAWNNNRSLHFDGECSFDFGATFHKYRFKHNTGATKMGAPEEVLSQHTLMRGKDMWMVGSRSRKPQRKNVYKNVVIRTCGATFTLDVISSRTWLFGYEAYRHFHHDIDCDRDPKLIMTAKVPDLAK